MNVFAVWVSVVKQRGGDQQHVECHAFTVACTAFGVLPREVNCTAALHEFVETTFVCEMLFVVDKSKMVVGEIGRQLDSRRNVSVAYDSNKRMDKYLLYNETLSRCRIGYQVCFIEVFIVVDYVDANAT